MSRSRSFSTVPVLAASAPLVRPSVLPLRSYCFPMGSAPWNTLFITIKRTCVTDVVSCAFSLCSYGHGDDVAWYTSPVRSVRMNAIFALQGS